MEEKIKNLVKELNILEKERLKREGFTNQCFFDSEDNLTKEYIVTYKEKKNYFYIDIGTSGAYLIEKSTGEIFNIKAYGVADRNKKIKSDLGNINTLTDIKRMHRLRYNYLR